jgi:hypothetical protein
MRAVALAGLIIIGCGASSAFLTLVANSQTPGASSADDGKNRFVAIERQDEIVTYDLTTVQMIQPGKFSVIQTTIAPPDVMKFKLKVLETLRTFCTRPDGKYPIPSEVFTLGPPDMSVENVEVGSQENFKMASWKLPYRRLAVIFATGPAEGFSFLHCKQPDNQTEEQLYWSQRNLITNGLQVKELFDCKRGLDGMFLHEDDDPRKVITGFVRQGSRIERDYFAVCYRVMQEPPYLPE